MLLQSVYENRFVWLTDPKFIMTEAAPCAQKTALITKAPLGLFITAQTSNSSISFSFFKLGLPFQICSTARCAAFNCNWYRTNFKRKSKTGHCGLATCMPVFYFIKETTLSAASQLPKASFMRKYGKILLFGLKKNV